MSEHKYTKQGHILINQDEDNYNKYIAQRARLKASKVESTELKDKVNQLEDDISQIKDMLSQLLNRG